VDALGPSGWGVGPGGVGPGIGLLGVEPAEFFAGGLEVLGEVQRWLDAERAGDPHAALAIGSIDYDGSTPLRLAVFRAVYRYDAGTRTAEVVGTSRPAVDQLAERVEIAARASETRPSPLPAPTKRTADADHARATEAVKAYIRAGDVYQVNLSRRLELPSPDPSELRRLFGVLALHAAAPYTAFLETRERTVLSASPECFLRVRGDRVETCPIKGTRPRGRTAAEDEAMRKELEASAKDQAEHVMIVDLERNDLGRVSRIGSVRVPSLARLESFSDVHHLVSRVEGRLRSPRDWPALFAATFPGGSITGAPKRRAMEIIAELEAGPRGLYTGAIGTFDSAGGIDLSIAIRTAVAEHGALALQLGGGIVADSDADEELREMRDKGRVFARSWDFDL
jgi:para-aminobenzoate synthetase component 1